MTDLVADLGGTNLRLGLVRESRLVDTESVRGSLDQAKLVDIIRSFAAQAGEPPQRAVLSVAGPVIGGVAHLTNRALTLSEVELSRDLGTEVRLINDLAATGRALPALSGDGIGMIRPGRPVAPGNGQALVVNVGTGFNVCAVRQVDGRSIVLESETGYAALPAGIATILKAELGRSADAVLVIEHLISGPGLARLIRELGSRGQDEDIARRLAARLFGMVCADLALRHWPDRGLWLTGSAARAMVSDRTPFLAGFDEVLGHPALPDSLREHLGCMPVIEIVDDLAPLRGCMAMLADWPS
ncbi:glucokinase [uncultured Paracoccus sp.]|uniref:glucokinase n=1 Tax=uncultured Paracoccus sp. TaxID=189685 RepID=UPI0026016650|nr:glucokinase [uncultured Paracoccus sp.]